jgi:chromate transporter
MDGRAGSSDSAQNAAAPPAAPAAVDFADALRFWFKLGCVSFGGPAGQIALMHQELVEKRRWISERRFLHALNYCMLLPGPEAQQLATYIGWLLHRTWGGIVAGGLFVLPSLTILIALSWIYLAFGDVPLVAGLFYGIKPAVTAIVLHAAQRIGSRTLKNGVHGAIALAAFAAVFFFAVPFPLIVAAAACVGLAGGALAPGLFSAAHRDAGAARSFGPALIDDGSPLPEHARFSARRALRVGSVCAVLWLAPMALLAAVFGATGTLTQMGVFFSKAALLTFGGAYAVLPYVYQGAVVDHAWLSAAQMIDGLALGETTPGPLIMVVAFVGYLGGHLKAVFGADALVLGGVAGACVATWFTFLPSFLFILLGAPLIETTHGRIAFNAPLSAITAAVVGVIANLALFFAYHVFWPQGYGGRFDAISAVIALLAAVALLRFERKVIEVIGGCAVLGLAARSLLG